MEDYGWIIEYFPQGRSDDPAREPVVQIIGHQFYTLLEASVFRESNVSVGQKVYIGKDQRKEINKIKGRISYNELSPSAKEILSTVIKSIVTEREAEYVNFMNKAGSISMRIHQLELLPGVGKKNLESILGEREKKPFDNFADIKVRVHAIPDPTFPFVHRIISELEGKEKHYLFLRPPLPPRY